VQLQAGVFEDVVGGFYKGGFFESALLLVIGEWFGPVESRHHRPAKLGQPGDPIRDLPGWLLIGLRF